MTKKAPPQELPYPSIPQEHPPHVYAAVITGPQDTCRFCDRPIIWGKTNTGRSAPFDPADQVNHWVTCPERDRARRAFPRTSR